MSASNVPYKYVEDIAIEIIKDSIVSRILYKDDALNVTLFAFDAGQALTEHTASQAAIIQILRGEATLTVGGETKEARAGAWLYMSPRLPHSIAARTPVVMLLTLVKP
jgi:quercetin dioxygenase-like cupin family protein